MQLIVYNLYIIPQGGTMNAIQFLINEHNRVRYLLGEISDESQRFEIQKKKFETLASDLIRHENMEQQVWYPYFKNKISTEVQHLVSEEKHAEMAIKALEGLKTKADWEAHFLKLKAAVEQHAQEEENELFPEVKRVLSVKELEEIGLKLDAFKKDHPLKSWH